MVTQSAFPNADISAGSWTPSAGGTLYGTLDETAADDGDYVSATTNTTMRVGLGALSSPVSGARTLSWRAKTSPEKKIIARLIQGASTVVDTFTKDPGPGTVTTYNDTITGTITNYADLDVEIELADATTGPTVGVNFGSIGTGVNGSTSIAVGYPASIVAGDMLALVVTSGATNSGTPDTPSGWTSRGSYASTDGTFGVDTGPRRVTVFSKEAVGGETGTVTVATTNGNTVRGTMLRFTKTNAAYVWDVAATGADDSTSGTDFSVTGSAIGFAPGDAVMVSVGQRVDTATQSGQSLTASGITFGTRTNRETTAVTTGNGHRQVIDTFAPITAGTATVAPTWAYTASAAVSGGAHILRLREIQPTEKGRVNWIRLQIPEADAGGAALDAAQSIPAFSQTATSKVLVKAAAAQAVPTFTQAATATVLVEAASAQSIPVFAQSATDTVLVKALAAQSVPAFTQSATGTVSDPVTSIEAAADQTVPAFGQSATVGVPVKSVAAQTVPAFSQTASASVTLKAAAAHQIPAFGQATTGLVLAKAAATQNVPVFITSATSAVLVRSSAAQSIPAFSQTATGTVGNDITAQSSQTVPSFGQSASGKVLVQSAAAQQIPQFSKTVTGGVLVKAAAAQITPAFLQTSASKVLVKAVSAQTIPVFGQAATDKTLVSSLAAQSIPAFGQSAASLVRVASQAIQTLPEFSQSAGGAILVSAAASQTVPTWAQNATLQVVSQNERNAVATQTIPAFLQSATDNVLVKAYAAQTIPAFMQSATAAAKIAGLAAQQIAPFAQAATIVVAQPGTAIFEQRLGISLDKDSASAITMFLRSSTDHLSSVIGANLVLSLSKAGSPFVGISRPVTEVGFGAYSVSLTAADTNIEGDLLLRATATGADGAIAIARVVMPYLAELHEFLGLKPGSPVITSAIRQGTTSVAVTLSESAGEITATREA